MTNREFNTGDLVIWTPEARKIKEKANASKAIKNRSNRKNANPKGQMNFNEPEKSFNWPTGIMKVIWGENESHNPDINPDCWTSPGWVEIEELTPTSISGKPIWAEVRITELEHLPAEDENLILSLDDIGL